MSTEPIAARSLDDWSQDAPGWWRNGVIYQIAEKLPPDTAGWFLLEVTR
jgi:hypothetical protein